MREIKFKAKRIDNGEWVYGSLLKTKYNYFIIQLVDEFRKEIERIPVIPETVCQLVAIIEGVGYYESDYIECYNHDSDTYYGGYLYFDDLPMSYKLEDNEGNVNDFYKYHVEKTTGNKHD